MRRAQKADTYALKQHWLSQNIPPVCSSFVLVIAPDMHLEPESEKREKNVDFLTTKNIQIQATLFAIFRRILSIDLRPIYCSLTTKPRRKAMLDLHLVSLTTRWPSVLWYVHAVVCAPSAYLLNSSTVL